MEKKQEQRAKERTVEQVQQRERRQHVEQTFQLSVCVGDVLKATRAVEEVAKQLESSRTLLVAATSLLRKHVPSDDEFAAMVDDLSDEKEGGD